MFTRISDAIKNLKIKYKILLCMITLTTIALLFISIVSYNYFASVYERDAKERTSYTLDVTSVSFRNHMDTILKNSSTLVSSEPILTILKDISINDTNAYLYNYSNIQDSLEGLIEGENFVDNVVMIGKNGEFFALTKYGLNHDISNYFGWDLKHVNGITLLPVCKSPLSYPKDVIPVILPISQINASSVSMTPIISGTMKDSFASLFILLDANQITDYFKELNKNVKSTLYLANENGEPINLTNSSDIYKIAANPDIIEHVKESSSSTEYTKSIDGDTFLIASQPVGACNLKIVSVVSKGELLSGIKTIKSFILAEWGLSCILMVILSFMLSQFITRPIVSLMGVVSQIKDGTYHSKNIATFNDEIGVLNRSINSMYDTIQQQIELIKQEEHEKAAAEIKILAEQINPHFIYNTLECIHLEILSENTKSSAAMIESLGQFLRVALNYGKPVISIQQELKHVTEYINIMNHRSNQRVTFQFKLDDRLKNFHIVKLILQPLVENCIKHGFANDVASGIIISPSIEVNISLKNNNRVSIEVSDNGRGIDIDKANDALYHLSTEDKNHHMGLNNIFNRLRLYYGNSTNMTFNTTPYYRNSVIIDIPYMDK